MNNAYPLDLTVIIPVYNAEQTLERSLAGIIEQRDLALEILCIDDESIDGSVQLIKESAQSYSQIKLLTQQHQGPAAARNLGIAEARGRYVAFVDADDYVTASFAKLIKQMEKNEADIIQFGYCLETPEAQLIASNELIEDCYLDGKECFTQLHQQRYGPSACFALYRREFLLRHQLYFPSDSNYEDAHFFRETLIVSKKTLLTPGIYYHYIRYPQSRSNKWNIDNLKQLSLLHIANLKALQLPIDKIRQDDAISFIHMLVSCADLQCKNIIGNYLMSLVSSDDELVVYGTGSSGKILMDVLISIGLKKLYFCESSDVNVGKYIINIKIISCEELSQMNNVKIIIGSSFIGEILDVLERKKLLDKCITPTLSQFVTVLSKY